MTNLERLKSEPLVHIVYKKINQRFSLNIASQLKLSACNVVNFFALLLFFKNPSFH